MLELIKNFYPKKINGGKPLKGESWQKGSKNQLLNTYQKDKLEFK